MKSGKLATYILTGVLTLGVAVYFIVHMTAYFTSSYAFSAAYAYTGEDAVTVSGYVVRDEEVLPGGGSLVYSSRAEGERVCAGGTVALVYDNAQAFESAGQLRALTDQMEQLSYAQKLAGGAQAAGGLDEEIAQAIVAFRADQAAGGEGGEYGQALRSAILRRCYAYAGTGDLDASAAALQTQIDSLTSAASAGASRITAPQAGFFSSMTDGYESVLSLAAAASLTPSSYRAITPQATAAGSVGKMVYGSTWGFVAMVRPEDLGDLEVGDSVAIRFQKSLDRDVTMILSSVSGEKDGRVVALFTCDKYLSLTTLLRQQNAQIIFRSYDGIRVPRSAVRVGNLPVTDEEGNPVYYESGAQKTEKVTGVYCLWGSTARLKPVEVLWQEDKYILVQPVAGTSEGRKLRAGDQVITTAEELFDGKVIQ